MKNSLIAICALALAGCASIETAGHASYEITPIAVGENIACGLKVADGKEFEGGRSVMFSGATCQLTVQEGPSKAFRGQAIAVKALGLPTTGLADILAPRDK